MENSLKLELFAQLEPNFGGMVTWWVHLRIILDGPKTTNIGGQLTQTSLF